MGTKQVITGTYAGPFMGSPLELDITALKGDSVFGRSKHRDQERALAGIRSGAAGGFRFSLREPGDSPFDGTFEMTLDTAQGVLTGSWTPLDNAELSETAFKLKQRR